MTKTYTKTELFDKSMTLAKLQSIAAGRGIQFESDANKGTLANAIVRKQHEDKLAAETTEDKQVETTDEAKAVLDNEGGVVAESEEGKGVEEVVEGNGDAALVAGASNEELAGEVTEVAKPVVGVATKSAYDAEASNVGQLRNVSERERIKNEIMSEIQATLVNQLGGVLNSVKESFVLDLKNSSVSGARIDGLEGRIKRIEDKVGRDDTLHGALPSGKIPGFN